MKYMLDTNICIYLMKQKFETFVTNNEREFKRIKSLCVENWVQ